MLNLECNAFQRFVLTSYEPLHFYESSWSLEVLKQLNNGRINFYRSKSHVANALNILFPFADGFYYLNVTLLPSADDGLGSIRILDSSAA